jgi:hypothetical protein
LILNKHVERDLKIVIRKWKFKQQGDTTDHTNCWWGSLGARPPLLVIQSYQKTVWQVFQKLNINLAYNLALYVHHYMFITICSSKYFPFFFYFFFSGTGIGIKGFVPAKQTVYHLSHNSSPFFLFW